MECSVCGETKQSELGKCRDCEEVFCVNCMVSPKAPPHPMVDWNTCESCYESLE